MSMFIETCICNNLSEKAKYRMTRIKRNPVFEVHARTKPQFNRLLVYGKKMFRQFPIFAVLPNIPHQLSLDFKNFPT
jgi:hypothetical protein